MDDARCVMAHGDAAIFYKNIPQSMLGIEFFTNTPCLAYVLSGKETFSSFEEDEIILENGQLLFMPKNSFMVSDFEKIDGPLEAFLFFFDKNTIELFLKNKLLTLKETNNKIAPYKLTSNPSINSYMTSLYEIYKDIHPSVEMVQLKLLELLNLLDHLDENKNLRAFLKTTTDDQPKRNIKRLLKNQQCWRLNVRELAQLSGRPITSFNRDFKRQFNTTPQKWLMSARLNKAYDLLEKSSLSISEISMEVGYDNISHFISIFKKKFGTSPKQIRLQNNW
ncbi:helix-turn-helix domain-containing protein [Curvivirga sp.]|uniref:helix-turn-helix domain-containing protein n=1 Tax=Curvivirga sp. TaxID=2856848 RepID=UPI003B5BFDB4